MSSIADELAALLSTVRTPGDFYAAGVTELLLPRLEVNGVGPIALPLLATQAEQLIAVAEHAPYGRGGKTLLDTTVRRTWQIDANQIRIEGKSWARTLEAIVARATAGLGVSEPVAADLYKLLIYDQGSHFVGHRDTEKAPGMFATLIITLPSLHAGGELLVRHKGREVRLDVRCEDPSEAAFAAFYADCVHEVLPVTSGCRMVLVYNLLRQGRGRLPMPPSYDKEQAGLVALLQRWSARKAAPDDDTPEKLVFPLEHAYTPAELSFPTLKGADAAAAAVLTASAQQSGCDLHVALLTIEESGSAEYTGYSRTRRWRSDDDESDEHFEIGEIIDCSRTLSDWGRPDGSPAAMGHFPIKDAELSPPDALADMEPDEQYFQEATGNEGASFERTYRRAALVLWPKERRLAVLNQAGLPVTLPYLEELTQRWVASGEDRESPLRREAHQLSGHMLRTWRKSTCYSQRDGESEGARMLALMARLKDTERIEAIMVDMIAAGGHGKSDNDAVLIALGLLPAQRAGELVQRIVASNAEMCPCSCADLLARSARVDSLADGLVPAGKALVLALPGDPAQGLQAEFAWQRQRIDVGFVVDIVSALSRIDANMTDSAVGHLLAWPKTYGVDAVILPAVRQLTGKTGTRTLAAVQRLRAVCLEHLRARMALALEAPSDWTRAAAPGCQCPRCGELSQFLANPGQRTWAFKASEPDRRHVEETIRRKGCDVDCATDKRGRPYSLVCTKNQASYERRVAQRKQDLEDLALLQ
ncbi:2OG-Fe(II) oxygenase [Variovorax sp. J22R133]|uniref:2OG-Fe(II) oxygenase n=1 Tax=Variovorax brevis TaxID=3053503 RepID=UPI00257602FC|nr:2OG-Fe(II) oxygenase [Variovorax sp. J22R133]MDM0116604.1 2OG-Fe(II) oxygenase [Variovorax sp. J22R133]